MVAYFILQIKGKCLSLSVVCVYLIARSLPVLNAFLASYETMKPVWPVVHFLWVGRVCALWVAGANSPAKIDWTP